MNKVIQIGFLYSLHQLTKLSKELHLKFFRTAAQRCQNLMIPFTIGKNFGYMIIDLSSCRHRPQKWCCFQSLFFCRLIDGLTLHITAFPIPIRRSHPFRLQQQILHYPVVDRQTAGGRGHHHQRRHQGFGNWSQDHAVKESSRPLFCRWSDWLRCLHRRLQSADRLGHCLCRRHVRGCFRKRMIDKLDILWYNI